MPALALVSSGVWLHAADGLLISTMMPAIVDEIGGIEFVAWAFALYEVGSIITGAASGLLALRYGIRWPMASAAIVFALGCLIGAVAPQMAWLLVGRLLQGLGGGGLMALAFVSIGSLFPSHLMARAMAVISTTWAVSAFLGPMIGGLFVEFATWRMGFLVFAFQAVALALWLVLRTFPGQSVEVSPETKFPFRRLFWVALGVVSIAYAGIDVSLWHTPGFGLLGLVCLAMFLRLDGRRTSDRLLPRHPISFRNPIGAMLVMVISITSASVALGVFGPLLVTELYSVSPLTVGLIIALEAIAWGIAAAVVSGSPERRDPIMIVSGMIAVSISLVGYLVVVPHGPLWMIGFFAIVQGLGFGSAWTFIVRRATSLAAAKEAERVAASIPTVQRLGYALGAAMIGVVANAGGIAEASDPSTLRKVATMIFLSCRFAPRMYRSCCRLALCPCLAIAAWNGLC